MRLAASSFSAAACAPASCQCCAECVDEGSGFRCAPSCFLSEVPKLNLPSTSVPWCAFASFCGALRQAPARSSEVELTLSDKVALGSLTLTGESHRYDRS